MLETRWRSVENVGYLFRRSAESVTRLTYIVTHPTYIPDCFEGLFGLKSGLGGCQGFWKKNFNSFFPVEKCLWHLG